MKTYVISKKETEKILDIVSKTWKNISIPKIKNIKVFEIEYNKSIVVIDSVVGVFIKNEIILPFLGKIDILRKIFFYQVDSGSINLSAMGQKYYVLVLLNLIVSAKMILS